ncbi:MAG: formylglycine-generating enzyme family protein, partial [Candidatus Magnetomorum sp.]|nr:formylglycine-generating enzyme family protein [Candidatus Magnetomorum sp.]
YMQTTEVTQGQWKAVMGSNPSSFSSCGDTCPVDNVSWNDIQEFIQKLNEKEGIDKYRLPTEAEWEYAARAGSPSAFANGGISQTGCEIDSNLNLMGWYCGNASSKTHPVAQKSANAWGLYDMHGNVWEWCQDWYGSYPTSGVDDPMGPSTGSNRVVRGGNWGGGARSCRSAQRGNDGPGARSGGCGCRLLRTP